MAVALAGQHLKAVATHRISRSCLHVVTCGNCSFPRTLPETVREQTGQLADGSPHQLLSNLSITSAKKHMQPSYLWFLATLLTQPWYRVDTVDHAKGWVREPTCHQTPNSHCIFKSHFAVTPHSECIPTVRTFESTMCFNNVGSDLVTPSHYFCPRLHRSAQLRVGAV